MLHCEYPSANVVIFFIEVKLMSNPENFTKIQYYYLIYGPITCYEFSN